MFYASIVETQPLHFRCFFAGYPIWDWNFQKMGKFFFILRNALIFNLMLLFGASVR